MAELETAAPSLEALPVGTPEKFQTPEEELAYLRERVKRKEEELESQNDDFESDRLAKREVVTYHDIPADEVLHATYQMPEPELMRKVLELEPEEHDDQVDGLLKIITERGIKNVLSIAAKIKSAHLEDDVHRALVQYIRVGLPQKGLKQSSEAWRALHQTLYEVSLPGKTGDEKEEQRAQELEKLLNSMEQFYAGLLSVTGSKGFGRKNYFSVEIATRVGSEEAVFYVSVPRDKGQLFEKHLVSIFPNAKIEETRGDYNIFSYGGVHVGGYAKLAREAVYPIRVYKEFTHDPLNIVLSAFSKLEKHTEGAAIQYVIGDDGDKHNQQYKRVITHLRKGENARRSVKWGMSPLREALGQIGEVFGDVLRSSPSDKQYKNEQNDQLLIDKVTQKISSRIVPVNIRIVASAKDEHRAEEILGNIASTFNQFEDGQGNNFKFEVLRGSTLRKFLRDFTFRNFRRMRVQMLSLQELTTMYHLTATAVSTSRELKQSRAKQVAAPIEVASDEDIPITTPSPNETSPTPTTKHPQPNTQAGIILGKNSFGGTDTFVRFKPEDRMRHFYEVGQTGTGKTHLMLSMIIQDIKNGEGCCYIDPHGSDIVDVLASIPPERHDDVIYFDPSHTERVMGLNMMEYNPKFPEQKTFVVNEMFSIFEKLFLEKSPESLGPMFEQYFRNAAMLVLEGMEPGTATMTDIPRVLANTQFRRACLANSKNPIVNQFWEEIAEKAGGEASLENIVPYITAKTDIFLGNSIMRPIISQPISAFNFREIMDERKILLVNLAKGRLGDLNSELLGLIIVGKFLQSALSRVDDLDKDLAPFYLYIDEFQNFTTPSIATILSEARKYKLSLSIAHQFIKQLDEKISNAVFGNVGTKCVFRVGTEDAEFLEKNFQPDFNAKDILGLDNFNAYISLLVDGKTVRPFNMTTIPLGEKDTSQIQALKQASYERYGRPLEEVEAEISERFAKKEDESVPDIGSFGQIPKF